MPLYVAVRSCWRTTPSDRSRGGVQPDAAVVQPQPGHGVNVDTCAVSEPDLLRRSLERAFADLLRADDHGLAP
jgi:hypothetical protein